MRFSLPSIKQCSVAPPSFRLPAKRGNQTVEHSAANETVGGAAEHLIDVSEKRICRLRLNFEST